MDINSNPLYITQRQILERSLRRFISEGTKLSSDKLVHIPYERVIPGQTKYLIPQAGDLTNAHRTVNYDTEFDDTGLFASLEFVSEREVGKLERQQYIDNKVYIETDTEFKEDGKDESYTISRYVVESVYSVNFYRLGAIDAANAVRAWSTTETGLTWAATALTDGQIVGMNIYGQSEESNPYHSSENKKYKDGDPFIIEYHREDPAGNIDFDIRKDYFARGVLHTDIKGNVEFAYIKKPIEKTYKGRMVSKQYYNENNKSGHVFPHVYDLPDYHQLDSHSPYGSKYSILPSGVLSTPHVSDQLLKPYKYINDRSDNILGDGSLKWAARGRGFFLSHPINVRNIAGIVSENWQERTQLDLYIQYDKIYADNDSGRIETIIGDHSSLTGRI